ncbi:MAG: sulfur carrier protein ThiS [Pseudomonadales bacterium]|nr:sulfur carrier protein ThiS [Pseudomonadales bacterium]
MNIVLNGDPQLLSGPMSISELISFMELTGKRIAVEINLDIIPASEHNNHMLKEADQIEVVAAIGGG